MTWEDNIRVKRREIGYQYGKWMKLAQDPVQWLALLLILLNLLALLQELALV
jgi:hypothetical protein